MTRIRIYLYYALALVIVIPAILLTLPWHLLMDDD